MTTTAEMLLEIAENLLVPRYSLSTAAGTSTTLIDANLDEPDELFNGGTIWFITGTLAGKSAVITSWDLPTHTFTFPNQGAAPGSGAQYAVLDARYPKDLLVGCLNMALQALGPFDAKNDTLTVVADQREYNLPAGVRGIKRLQYSNESSGASFTYGPVDHWWDERNGVLYLSKNRLRSAGTKMRLWYGSPHARVYADTDAITDAVHPDRIAWIAAWNAARARNSRADTVDPATKELEQKAQVMVQLMAREHPVEKMVRDAHWLDL